MIMRKYNITSRTITESGGVTVLDNCNGWTVINKGTAEAQVNGVVLAGAQAAGLTGDSFGITGNADEVFDVTSPVNVVFGSPGTRKIIFVQKIYVS